MIDNDEDKHIPIKILQQGAPFYFDFKNGSLENSFVIGKVGATQCNPYSNYQVPLEAHHAFRLTDDEYQKVFGKPKE